MLNLSCENEFYLHENEKLFPYQRLSTYPRFETETRGNSEMANCESIQFHSYPEKPAHISRLHHWFPGEMRNERRNSILMCLTTQWLDPLIAVVPQEKIVLTIQKIRVVTRHKYGVSSRVTLTLFRGETSGGIAKRRLFSQATSTSCFRNLLGCCKRRQQESITSCNS